MRHTKTSEELGGAVVDRYIVLVYQVGEREIRRIFAAESARVLEGSKIVGTLAFRPAARGLALETGPGRAVGWSQKNYPFPEDTQAAGGVEPLVLPWSKTRKRRYEFDGLAFVEK